MTLPILQLICEVYITNRIRGLLYSERHNRKFSLTPKKPYTYSDVIRRERTICRFEKVVNCECERNIRNRFLKKVSCAFPAVFKTALCCDRKTREVRLGKSWTCSGDLDRFAHYFIKQEIRKLWRKLIIKLASPNTDLLEYVMSAYITFTYNIECLQYLLLVTL